MTNTEYLKMFNLVDIASSYDGKILDGAVLESTRIRRYPSMAPGDQSPTKMKVVDEAAKELCLATAFVLQCDRSHYGKLLKDLEYEFTKGHNNYPPDMAKAYQLLNEYKHWKPTLSVQQSEGIAFAQKGRHEGNGSPEWAANKTKQDLL
jgi:hypothetical protein